MSALPKEEYNYTSLARVRTANNTRRRAQVTKIYDYDEYYEQEHQNQRRTRHVERERAQKVEIPEVDAKAAAVQRKEAVKNIALIMFIFAVLSVVVARYAIISVNDLENYEIKENINVLNNEIDSLELKVTMQSDITEITTVAETQLNMGFPTDNQVYYLSVNPAAATEPTINEESSWFNNASEWILGVKSKIKELFT